MRKLRVWSLLPAVLLACAWTIGPAAHSTLAAPPNSYTVASTGYNWEEINSTGTSAGFVPPVDDQLSSLMPIPFLFPFYGNSYNGIYADTNGFATFDSGSNSTYF